MWPPAQSPTKDQKAHWYQSIGNGAQIASALIAFGAACLVLWQVRIIQQNSENSLRVTREAAAISLNITRETAARQVYQSYMEASMRFPQFYEPDWAEIQKDKDERGRYKSFVAHMLYAYDEILSMLDAPQWEAAFRYDLAPHFDYVCAEESRYFEQFYERVHKLVREECHAAAEF